MVETKLVLSTLQFKIIQVWEAYWVLVQNTSNGWTFHEAYYFLNDTFQMGLNYLTNSRPISRIADKVIHNIRRPRCTMYPHILKTHNSGKRPQKQCKTTTRVVIPRTNRYTRGSWYQKMNITQKKFLGRKSQNTENGENDHEKWTSRDNQQHLRQPFHMLKRTGTHARTKTQTSASQSTHGQWHGCYKCCHTTQRSKRLQMEHVSKGRM